MWFLFSLLDSSTVQDFAKIKKEEEGEIEPESDQVFRPNQQFKSLKGTPMSPGNYIVSRYTNFAFYNVVDDGEVASEAMLGYVDDINNELTRKRAEYGFLTAEDYKAKLAEKSAK